MTGQDFAYNPKDSVEERAIAIKKAQEWWDLEGRAKYTFDNIETLLKDEAEKGVTPDE